MYDVNKLVAPRVATELLNLLPTPKQRNVGRPRCPKEALLTGILQVLVNGVAWKKLTEGGASSSSCHRYFQELQRRGLLKEIFQLLQDHKTCLLVCAADTTTATSFRFRHGTGWDGKHRKVGTKISLLTDQTGLPADVEFGKGSKHDLRFIPTHRKNTHGRRKKVWNLDKGYTSLELRRALRNSGTVVNMGMRRGDYTAKRGPKFGFDREKYQVRFLVERTNAWLKAFKRIRTRVEYKLSNYKAFVYLALIIILLRS